jgi:hypothetical protein
VEPNRATPISISLGLSALTLLSLLLAIGYLTPLSLRAVVLAVGLGLLGEVVWLRLPKEALLRAFAYRALLLFGWTTTLCGVLLGLQLIPREQALALPWLGLSLGPLFAAAQVLQLVPRRPGLPTQLLHSGARSADPLAWFRQRLLRRSGTVILAGLLTTAQLVGLVLAVLLLWLPKQGWSFWRAFPPAVAMGEWLWLLAAMALLASIEEPLVALPAAASFPRREAVWHLVVHRLLLLPSRLAMVHALLTYLGFAGGGGMAVRGGVSDGHARAAAVWGGAAGRERGSAVAGAFGPAQPATAVSARESALVAAGARSPATAAAVGAGAAAAEYGAAGAGAAAVTAGPGDVAFAGVAGVACAGGGGAGDVAFAPQAARADLGVRAAVEGAAGRGPGAAAGGVAA